MPLRPIDAIFVHPKERFYVIYQHGELYKLTRMKLDKASWQHRTPYTGNAGDIFLAKNQTIADSELSQILTTHTLPDTLHGRSLTFFKDWWRMNGYRWLKDSAPNKTQTETTSETDDDSVILLGEENMIKAGEDDVVFENIASENVAPENVMSKNVVSDVAPTVVSKKDHATSSTNTAESQDLTESDNIKQAKATTQVKQVIPKPEQTSMTQTMDKSVTQKSPSELRSQQTSAQETQASLPVNKESINNKPINKEVAAPKVRSKKETPFVEKETAKKATSNPLKQTLKEQSTLEREASKQSPSNATIPSNQRGKEPSKHVSLKVQKPQSSDDIFDSLLDEFIND